MKKIYLILFTMLLLSFTGICQTAQLIVSSDIQFGDIPLGSSKTDYVIVRNVSGFAITYQITNLSNFIPPIQSATVECGSVQPDIAFSTSGNYSGTLQPGQRDTLKLTFAPKDYDRNLPQGSQTICTPKCVTIPNCVATNTSGNGSYTANISVSQTNGTTFTKIINIVGKGVTVTSTQDMMVTNNAQILYPNPVQDKFKVDILDANVILYNGLGEKVLSQTKVTGEISVLELPAGIYTAEVFTTDGKKFFQKLVKE